MSIPITEYIGINMSETESRTPPVGRIGSFFSRGVGIPVVTADEAIETTIRGLSEIPRPIPPAPIFDPGNVVDWDWSSVRDREFVRLTEEGIFGQQSRQTDMRTLEGVRGLFPQESSPYYYQNTPLRTPEATISHAELISLLKEHLSISVNLSKTETTVEIKVSLSMGEHEVCSDSDHIDIDDIDHSTF